jgi:hypothetical protein
MIFENKFLIISGMLFATILVITVWLLLVGQYLLVSGVTYSVILLLVSYLQLLNSRIVYDSFIQSKTCYERFRTAAQVLEIELTEEA